MMKINLLLTNIPILYALKTPENQSVFRERKSGNIGQKCVKKHRDFENTCPFTNTIHIHVFKR